MDVGSLPGPTGLPPSTSNLASQSVVSAGQQQQTSGVNQSQAGTSTGYIPNAALGILGTGVPSVVFSIPQPPPHHS